MSEVSTVSQPPSPTLRPLELCLEFDVTGELLPPVYGFPVFENFSPRSLEVISVGLYGSYLSSNFIEKGKIV